YSIRARRTWRPSGVDARIPEAERARARQIRVRSARPKRGEPRPALQPGLAHNRKVGRETRHRSAAVRDWARQLLPRAIGRPIFDPRTQEFPARPATSLS